MVEVLVSRCGSHTEACLAPARFIELSDNDTTNPAVLVVAHVGLSSILILNMDFVVALAGVFLDSTRLLAAPLLAYERILSTAHLPVRVAEPVLEGQTPALLELLDTVLLDPVVSAILLVSLVF